MSEEWGPWIEHDGKGCPVQIGLFVEVMWRADRSGDTYTAGQEGTTCGVVTDVTLRHPAWDWINFGCLVTHPASGRIGRMDGKYLRYRIRRPKGMAILLANLATIPTDLDTDVPVEILNPELGD